MNGFSTWNLGNIYDRHYKIMFKTSLWRWRTQLIFYNTRCNKLEMWSQSALTLDWGTKSPPELPGNHFQPFLLSTRRTCEVILGTDVSFCDGKFSEIRHAADECAWHLTLEIFSSKKGSQRSEFIPCSWLWNRHFNQVVPRTAEFPLCEITEK